MDNAEDLHIIYDFETVDNKPTSAVASIAINVFNPAENKTFEELVNNSCRIKFNIDEQFKKFGRTWGQETVDWWNHIDQKDAYDMVIKPSKEDVSLKDFFDILKNYLEKSGYDIEKSKGKIWTRGNSFDPPILDNIFERFGWQSLMPWWNVRDVRTEIDCITPYWNPEHEGYGYVKEFEYPDGFIKHKEEHDIARDILMMQYTHIKFSEWLEGNK